MRIVKLLLLLLIMLIGVAFTMMNPERVNLNYYFGSRELPLSVVMVGAIAFGALLGGVVSIAGWLRVKRENARLKREVKLASHPVDDAAESH